MTTCDRIKNWLSRGREIQIFAVVALMPLCLDAQVLVVRDVTKLPVEINSEIEETMPLLSPDGSTLYFGRLLHPDNIGGKNAGSDVWRSRRGADGLWGKASNRTLAINTKSNNTLIGINRKGDVFYVLNTWGIYFAKKTGDSWTKPEMIHIPDFDPDGFVGAYVSPDYDFIFISMQGKDSQGEEDLYISFNDGHDTWSAPRNLGPTINTKGFEISPFLSADKKRLFFSSNGHPGYGDADIFYSDRLYNSWENWSAPKNLGDKINSKAFDGYLSYYDSIVFFSSNRDNSFSDLYQARVGNSIDSRQEQVNKIVEEAHTLLADIKSEATDSIQGDRETVLLNFSYNTSDVSSKAARQLDKIANLLKSRVSPSLTLTALSSDFEQESLNNELSYKRAEAIKNYLQTGSLPRLKVNIEVKSSVNRTGKEKEGVLVQYSK